MGDDIHAHRPTLVADTLDGTDHRTRVCVEVSRPTLGRWLRPGSPVVTHRRATRTWRVRVAWIAGAEVATRVITDDRVSGRVARLPLEMIISN